MDEEVILDLFNRAKSKGYGKTVDDFKELIVSDDEVLQDNFNYVKSKGYTKGVDQFKTLVGVDEQPITEETLVEKKNFDSESADGISDGSEKIDQPVEETPPTLQEYQESFGVLPEDEQTKVFKERLSRVDVANKSEEQLVPELNALFGDYNFKFEETGITDNVKITAPNGEEKVVNIRVLPQVLDPGLGLLGTATDYFFGTDDETADIKSFIKQNRDVSINVDETKKKIINEKELDDYTKDFNAQAKTYLQKEKELNQERDELNRLSKEVQEGTPEFQELAVRKENYAKLEAEITSIKEGLSEKGKEYDAMVGEYALMRKEQGTFFGQVYDSVKKGVGNMLGFGAEFVSIPIAFGLSKTYKKGQDFDEILKEVKYGKEEKFVNPFSDIATLKSRDLDKGFVEMAEEAPLSVLGESSTKEYLEDYQQADLFSAKGLGNVLFGVTEFLPAAAGGMLGTIAMSSQYVNQEMRDNPEFDDVSEFEKAGVSLTIGTAVGALEKFGFTNVLKSKPMTALIYRAFNRNPASMRTVNEYISQEVKSLMAKGLLRMGAGGVAEFETGALQEVADIGFKELYNSVKGTDMFETPESIGEAVQQVIMAGVAEGMGGTMMATPKALSYALGTKELSEIDDNTFKIFESMSKDSKYLDFVTSKLEQQVVNGEITTKEKDRILGDYNRLNGALQKMPDGIDSPRKKKQLLGLLMDHQSLSEKIQRTDDVFNKSDKKELKNIESRIDAVLNEVDAEVSVSDVLNMQPGESKVFYAETLDDVPEQYRDRAEKVERGDQEVTFRDTVFGLPIGKKKDVSLDEYYTYTLDGSEVNEVVEKESEKVPENRMDELDSIFQTEKKETGEAAKDKRTVGNVMGKEVTMNGEKGVIKQDPNNPGTVIFESTELEEDVSGLEQEVETLAKTIEDIDDEGMKAKLQSQLDTKTEELNQRKKRKKKVVEIGNTQDVMMSSISDFNIEEDRRIEGRIVSTPDGDFRVIKESKDKKGNTVIVLEDLNTDKKKADVNERLRKGQLTKKQALAEINRLEKSRTKKYTGDQAVDILKRSRQRGKEVETDGYFGENPPEGTLRVSDGVSVILGDSTISERNKKRQRRIVEMAKRASDALSKVMPNLRILIHSNYDTFTEETGYKTVRGVFDPTTNTIHINLSKAKLTTVGHEILHAILVNRLKTDKNVEAAVNDMIDSVKKSVGPEVSQQLDKFVKRYSNKKKNEEYVAELFGILSENYGTFTSKAKKAIKEFIDKIRKMFNLPIDATTKDQEVFEFLDTLARKVGEGELVVEEDLSLIGEVQGDMTAKERKQKMANIKKMIQEARKRGFSNQEIKDYLMKKMGYTQAQVNKLFPTKQKTSKKPTKKSLKQLIEEKAKTKKGKIPQRVTTSLINESQKLDLNNQKAVDAFLEKVKNIYDRAGYVQELSEAKKNRKDARRNIKKDFGPSIKPFIDIVERILSVPPSMLPADMLQEYNEFMREFSVNKAAKVFEDIEAKKEQSIDLLERIETVLEDQVELDTKKDPDPSVAKKKRDDNISQIKEKRKKLKNKVSLSNKYDNELAEDLLSVTDEELNQMEDSDIAKLNNILSQIDQGFIGTFSASKLQVVLNGKIRGGGVLNNKVNMKKAGKFYVNSLGKLFANFKSAVSEDTKLLSMMRSTITSQIDTLLGNFNSQAIYDATFGKLAKNMERYTRAVTEINVKLENFNELIAGGKVFKKLNNTQLLSKFRIMASLLEDEYQANKGRKGVASATEYLENTIRKLEEGNRSQRREADLLQKLKDEIDSKGIVLSKKEQKGKKIIKEINDQLSDMAAFVFASRGKRPTMYANYIHHSAIYDKKTHEKLMDSQLDSLIKPSTEAGTGYARTNNKVISFDPAYSTLMGAKQTLLDFHMSQAVKEVRASISVLKNSKDRPKRQAGIALNKAFDESLDIVLSDSFSYYGMAEKVVDKIRKLSYYATLASVPRAAAELSSNFFYATIVSPASFIKGVTSYNFLNMGFDGGALMDAVGSENTNKLYGRESLMSGHADAASFNRSSFNKSKAKGGIMSAAQFIAENTLVGPLLVKSTNLVSQTLISTPDKAISRPLWFGTFFGELERLTGRKFSKAEIKEMAEGKSPLLKEFKTEIEAARKKADRSNVQMATSGNAFNTVLKDNIRLKGDKAGGFKNTYRYLNTYMAKFVKNEYATSRAAIQALFNSGDISRPHAVALLIGVTTRMTSYMVLYTLFRDMWSSMFGFEDEEEDPDYGLLTARQLTGSFVSLMTRRALGNIPYMPIAFGTEVVNEKGLQALRNDEEYDPFKDAIVFNMVSYKDLTEKNPYELWLNAFAGPFGPIMKSTFRTQKVLQRVMGASKKSTRDKYKKEFLTRSILEMAGNAGLIPFYKDIRREVVRDLFKEKSGGGMNLTDSQKKKYFPDIYRMEQSMKKEFESSSAYQMQKQLKAEQKRMKEEMLRNLR